MKILVLGIGNTLMVDDGVGIVAMRELQTRFGQCDEMEFLDGGTLSFALAVPLAECDAMLVIDAAEFGALPGEVRTFEGEDMDRFLGASRKRSVHEVGLFDLMAISLLSGHWPQRRALIGVQPGTIAWGEELSPAVAAAIPDVCSRARNIITGFGKRIDLN
jgi:hydrogenase maturation protease